MFNINDLVLVKKVTVGACNPGIIAKNLNTIGKVIQTPIGFNRYLVEFNSEVLDDMGDPWGSLWVDTSELELVFSV